MVLRSYLEPEYWVLGPSGQSKTLCVTSSNARRERERERERDRDRKTDKQTDKEREGEMRPGPRAEFPEQKCWTMTGYDEASPYPAYAKIFDSSSKQQIPEAPDSPSPCGFKR